MITRLIVFAWVVGAVICGINVLVDAQTEIHGEVDPAFCTDCPRFKQWMEEQDG